MGTMTYREDNPWPRAQFLGVRLARDALVDLGDADWGLCRTRPGEGSIDELLEGWGELRHDVLYVKVRVSKCVCVYVSCSTVTLCGVEVVSRLSSPWGTFRCHSSSLQLSLRWTLSDRLGFLWVSA